MPGARSRDLLDLVDEHDRGFELRQTHKRLAQRCGDRDIRRRQPRREQLNERPTEATRDRLGEACLAGPRRPEQDDRLRRRYAVRLRQARLSQRQHDPPFDDTLLRVHPRQCLPQPVWHHLPAERGEQAGIGCSEVVELLEISQVFAFSEPRVAQCRGSCGFGMQQCTEASHAECSRTEPPTRRAGRCLFPDSATRCSRRPSKSKPAPRAPAPRPSRPADHLRARRPRVGRPSPPTPLRTPHTPDGDRRGRDFGPRLRSPGRGRRRGNRAIAMGACRSGIQHGGNISHRPNG